MPTERAHGIQIVKTCEALSNAGAQVELVVPNRATPIQEGVKEYYDLKTEFPITRLTVIDTVSWGFLGFALESLVFALQSARYIHVNRGRTDALMYGRDEVVLAAIALLSARDIVWESHTGAWNFIARYVAHRAKKVVVISNSLRDFYLERGIAAEKIIVAHDGIDLSDFENLESKAESRKRLGTPNTARVALYVGSFGGWKGTDTLLEASAHLSDAQIVVIGAASESLKTQYPRVTFLGEKPYRDLAHNLQIADILILPTSGKEPVGASFTSPLKLFAYMASGIPIIASDVPSTREVLSEDAAYWFEPDDAQSLVAAIRFAFSDPSRTQKASLAREAVSLYTWEMRAKTILKSL